MALLVASSVSPAWWNPEGLFQRIFFVSGSLGEKIRRKDVLRNRKRREIYYFIVNFPFSHFRRITRKVGVGPNEGSWHLRILEKMGLIKSEHLGRYLIYHANNIDSRSNRPASLIPNSNATKILEYLHRNPGAKITHVTRALMMNRNTVSYHIKRMQTSGIVEREETDGLRLARTGDDHGEGLAHVIPNPTASKIDVALPKVT
jgi:predicted transcriptional regulator